jgi:hypothetical protein
MDSRTIGLIVVVLGISVVLVGLLILSGGMGWFGRLPGDLRIERDNVRVYLPIASMLIISIVLSLVLAIFRRWFS